MNTTVAAELAPAELSELVIETLRQADRPLSAHATAQALIAHDAPRGTRRSELVHTVSDAIATVLRVLVADGRVRSRWAGGVYVYEAIHPTAEIEARINILEAALGGRHVRIGSGGTDPVVTVTAPLSRIEAIGR